MRNCISYELTKKLAERRAKQDRIDNVVGFFLPLAFMICAVVCLGIVLCA